MKKMIISKCLNFIKKYRNISNDEEKIIAYGLEGIYLTITKMIIIGIVAIILGLFKEMIIFFITLGILRTFSSGIHAKKSWMCLVSSLLIFILVPYLALSFNINYYIKLVFCILGLFLIYKFSPADTIKKPIVNFKRRKKLKLLSTLICFIYVVLSLIINDTFYSNCFFYSIIVQNILISPLTYKLFKMPYNNYINYLKMHPELNNL